MNKEDVWLKCKPTINKHKVVESKTWTEGNSITKYELYAPQYEEEAIKDAIFNAYAMGKTEVLNKLKVRVNKCDSNRAEVEERSFQVVCVDDSCGEDDEKKDEIVKGEIYTATTFDHRLHLLTINGKQYSTTRFLKIVDDELKINDRVVFLDYKYKIDKFHPPIGTLGNLVKFVDTNRFVVWDNWEWKNCTELCMTHSNIKKVVEIV